MFPGACTSFDRARRDRNAAPFDDRLHVSIEGDYFPGETHEVTAARVLAHACDQLRQILDDYRRRVQARLAEQRRADPF